MDIRNSNTSLATPLDDLWSVASELYSWDVTEPDPVTSLTGVLSLPPGKSFLIHLDPVKPARTLRKAAEPLATVTPKWGIVLPLSGLSTEEFCDLVRQFPLYLLDIRRKALIRVHSDSPASALRLLGSGWLYRDHALLLSTPDMVLLW